jgi:hypothetical protein
LAPSTENQVIQEYQNVVLQAGYQTGKYGVIFKGSIKQFRRGHESATDTFLDIYAGDGDPAFLFAVLNKTLATGATVQQRAQVMLDENKKYGLGSFPISNAASTAANVPGDIRGQTYWGMNNTELVRLGRQVGWTMTVTDGKLSIIPLNGYLPGEALQLSASTGMIGWPEQTQAGINVTTLLNPAIHVQNLVQIDNADINQTRAPSDGFNSSDGPFVVTGFPNPRTQSLYQPVTDDGIYKVIVVEHEGDTRGNPWYTNMVCLAVDAMASPTKRPMTRLCRCRNRLRFSNLTCRSRPIR